MTASQRGLIASPATGLMVYQTDAPAGFYFYNGSAWTTLNGTNGQGVPTGGTTGQVLAKVNATDFNTQWVTPSGGASASILPSAQLPHNTTGFATIYYSPFNVAGSNTNLGVASTFLAPGANAISILISSFEDEGLTFQFMEVTPNSGASTYSEGTVLSTVTTAASTGTAQTTSITATLTTGKVYTIKVTKTAGGAFTTTGGFYTNFTAN